VKYHDLWTIANAFKVSCMLHNILLKYDGYADFNWDNKDPNGNLEGEAAPTIVVNAQAIAEKNEDEEVLQQEELSIPSTAPEQLISQAIAVPTLTQNTEGEVEEEPNLWCQANYRQLRGALAKHLQYAYTNGQLKWPNKFSKHQKKSMPLLKIVLSRVEAYCRAVLRIAPSQLRRCVPGTNNYSMTIGNGLFSTIAYGPGDHIVRFVGEVLRTAQEANTRTAAGRGGYMLGTSTGTGYFLDCFE